MLASNRNRGTRNIANPRDGFSNFRRYKAPRKSGQSGKRLMRRILRSVEHREWQRATYRGE